MEQAVVPRPSAAELFLHERLSGVRDSSNLARGPNRLLEWPPLRALCPTPRVECLRHSSLVGGAPQAARRGLITL